MLKRISILLVVYASSFATAPISAPSKRQTVDKILAICYTPEGVSVITQSDLRPGIDGVPRQLKDIILNRLILLDGKKLKIVKDDKDAEQKADDDRYLGRIQKQYKLTHDDIVKLFKEMGYSYEEGLEELRTMRLLDNVLDQRVRSKVMIDKKDIELYCAEHPVYSPAVYTMSVAVIPADTRATRAEQLEKINESIKSGAILDTVEWGPSFDQAESDIASEKAFIKEAAVGSVIKLEESPEEIKLLKIIKKVPAQLVPCTERTREVQNILGKERFEKALEKYHADLWTHSHVRYLDKDQAESASASQAKAPANTEAKS